ncbi:MAG: SusD family outer membrane lipoprotein NanU [Chitinophagales bacterium]
MKKIISIVLSGLTGIVFFSSCSKQLDLSPISSIGDASYWKTADQFDAFVTGIHTSFRAQNVNFEYLGEMRADVFGTDPGSGSAFTGEATQGIEHMWLQTLDLDNSQVPNFGGFYTTIVQINLLINKLNTTNIVSAANKNYYLGIAHGMRAYYYFQLLRSWGAVVIQTDPVSNINVGNLSKAASSADDVMKLVKSDIDSSMNSFGADYSFKNKKSFWSKPATLMLQAEVYLWTSYRGGGAADATVAENALSDIQTNVPSLGLLPNYPDVFATTNRGNNEIIFSIRYLLNEATMGFVSNTYVPQTGLISNFYDSADNRQFNPTTDNWGGLLRAPIKISTFRLFDDKDSRKWTTIQPAYNLVAGNYQIAGCFVQKYPGEQSAGIRQFTNDYPVYRYADLLLLKAEAEIILGQDPSNEINVVRARAFGTNYDPLLYGYPNRAIDANPQEALLQERFFEFIFEGKRWYDLRRMGDNFVYEHTTLLAADAYKLLWPIDRASLTNNRALVQNPGYASF